MLQQLAYLGVGELAPVDTDKVDLTSLNPHGTAHALCLPGPRTGRHYGVLAEIEAPGLDLLEVRPPEGVTAGRPTGASSQSGGLFTA